jgi:hypothetical protein
VDGAQQRLTHTPSAETHLNGGGAGDGGLGGGRGGGGDGDGGGGRGGGGLGLLGGGLSCNDSNARTSAETSSACTMSLLSITSLAPLSPSCPSEGAARNLKAAGPPWRRNTLPTPQCNETPCEWEARTRVPAVAATGWAAAAMVEAAATEQATVVAAAKAAREVAAEEMAATAAAEVAKAVKEAGEEGAGKAAAKVARALRITSHPCQWLCGCSRLVVCTPGHPSSAPERIQGTLSVRLHRTDPRPCGATRTRAH